MNEALNKRCGYVKNCEDCFFKDYGLICALAQLHKLNTFKDIIKKIRTEVNDCIKEVKNG